MSSTWLTSQN